MTTILIDNATVSSVQRALGKAKLRDSGVLDVEHAALERFVEAILFADKVVVPDNYKEKFTPARKALLDAFNVQFLPIDEPIDASLTEVAHQMTGMWTEAFAEGRERSLFNQYFDQVQAFSSFIWEHSSSQFFLVFRAHGIGKESPLIEALLASPKNDDIGKALRIVAKDGRQVSWSKLSPHVQRMLGIMGWLGHQYIWHQVLAARHDFIYSPHPLREFFANDFLSRLGETSSSAALFQNVFQSGMTRFKGKVNESRERLGALTSTSTVNLPVLLPVLLCECGTADEFISVLAEMRKNPKVIEIRQTMSQMQADCDKGDYRMRARFISDMEKIGDSLLLERGLDRRLLRIKPPTSIIGISVDGDDTGLQLPIPSVLYRQFFFNRRYRTFLRDVMGELAAPAQYGKLKTKLNSWAWLEEQSEYSGNPFYLKQYRFPSKFHLPLENHSE